MAFHPIPASIAGVFERVRHRVIRDAAGLEDHIRAAAGGSGSGAVRAGGIGEKLWARDRCTVYVG